MKNWTILTKKEISEKLRITRRSGFGRGFDYNASVRGFDFESLTDQPAGEIYERDNQGFCTKVASCENKKEVVNAIYEWFKEYASQNFDEL